MNTKDVAKRLGCTVATVRNLVEKGRIAPREIIKTSGQTWFIFDPEAIEVFALTYRKRESVAKEVGKTVEVKAFEMLASGHSWRDLVIECKIGVDDALRLYRLYQLEPEQIEKLEAIRRQEKEMNRRANQERTLASKAEWRKHQERMGELRAKYPAPLIVQTLPLPKPLPVGSAPSAGVESSNPEGAGPGEKDLIQ